jgi:hypothetical protein
LTREENLIAKGVMRRALAGSKLKKALFVNVHSGGTLRQLSPLKWFGLA